MDWYEARNWCKQKKMRLAEFKNINLFHSDGGRGKDIFEHLFGKEKNMNSVWKVKTLSILQTAVITGWVLQTLAARLDNFSGEMAHRWTIHCGAMENLAIMIWD